MEVSTLTGKHFFLDESERSKKERFPLSEIEERFAGESITIVGNGPTGISYQPKEGETNIWTINNGFQHTPETSLAFVMDDITGPAWDAHTEEDKRSWEHFFRNNHIPVMTCHVPEGYNGLVEYPIVRVMNEFTVEYDGEKVPLNYFAETVSYMIAFAILIKVKDIRIVGCDYYGGDVREQRACTEFWSGMAWAKGIFVTAHPDSRLLILPPLNYIYRHIHGFYGYTPKNFPLQVETEERETNMRSLDDLKQIYTTVTR